MTRLAFNRVLRDRTSKDCTIGTVGSVNLYKVGRLLLAETSRTPAFRTYKSNISATRTDIALLVSVLFLQRFTLPFGKTFLGLEFVAVLLILLHQFLSGKLQIQYDRFLWFLAFALAITCSLLLNFKSTMLTGYFQFMVSFSLFTLSRPSTSDQYKGTLQGFQTIVMLLSCLGVAQFVAQFVVDGRKLINFYGIVPDFLTSDFASYWSGDIRNFSGIIKSTGMFLSEPSIFSQVTALGILIEVLEFRRPRYLLVIALGFLVAYSGTGLMLLLIFLPLAGLRHGRAGLSALLVVVFILGLFATGIIHLSVFTSRISEFNDMNSSGFARFVAPFWLAAKRFETASLGALLVGSGPGTVNAFGDAWYVHSVVNWFMLVYQYGIIGSFIVFCFSASCLRRSRCPGLVIAAIIFNYLFEQGPTGIAIALCTLNGPEHRRHRINKASRYGPSLVAGSASG
jgi:hypothetical protein